MKKANYSFRASLFMTFVFFCLSTCLFANEEEIPKLSVKGEVTLRKPANELHLTVGVLTEGKNADNALKSNSDKMKSVLEAIQKAGLAKDEFQTGQFSIQPTYTVRPKNPPEDWRSEINGYQVSNQINVKTSKIGLAGEIIDAASRAGANTIDNIMFTLSDPQAHRADAITAATQNALANASVLAKAANVSLVRVMELSLDNAFENPRMIRPNLFLAKAASSDELLTPIEPGDVEVKANVNLVYEIKTN